MILDGFWIDFRDDQWDIVIHPPGTTFVNDCGTSFDGPGQTISGYVIRCAGNHQVNTIESLGSQFFYNLFLSTKA